MAFVSDWDVVRYDDNLRPLSLKVKTVTMRVYSKEFRMQVVRRILDGEKISALSQELGIHRKLLYEWLRRVNLGGESNLRVRGRPRRIDSIVLDGSSSQVEELERTVAHQQLIIEFFRLALQQVEKLRHERSAIGAMASLKPSRR